MPAKRAATLWALAFTLMLPSASLTAALLAQNIEPADGYISVGKWAAYDGAIFGLLEDLNGDAAVGRYEHDGIEGWLPSAIQQVPAASGLDSANRLNWLQNGRQLMLYSNLWAAAKLHPSAAIAVMDLANPERGIRSVDLNALFIERDLPPPSIHIVKFELTPLSIVVIYDLIVDSMLPQDNRYNLVLRLDLAGATISPEWSDPGEGLDLDAHFRPIAVAEVDAAIGPSWIVFIKSLGSTLDPVTLRYLSNFEFRFSARSDHTGWTVRQVMPYSGDLRTSQLARVLAAPDGQSLLTTPLYYLSNFKDALLFRLADGTWQLPEDFSFPEMEAGNGYYIGQSNGSTLLLSATVPSWIAWNDGQWRIHELPQLQGLRGTLQFTDNNWFHSVDLQHETVVSLQLDSQRSLSTPWFEGIGGRHGWQRHPWLGDVYTTPSVDPSRTWMWHEGLGWVHLTSRSTGPIWVFDPVLGPLYLSPDQLPEGSPLIYPYAARMQDFIALSLERTPNRLYQPLRGTQWFSDYRIPRNIQEDWLENPFSEDGFTLRFTSSTTFVIINNEYVDGRWVSTVASGSVYMTRSSIHPSSATLTFTIRSIDYSSQGLPIASFTPASLWEQHQEEFPEIIVFDMVMFSADSGRYTGTVTLNNGVQTEPESGSF